MWSKTGQAAQPSQATPPQPTGATTVSSAPSPKATVLGKDTKIIGELSSEDELYVDGELEGKLTLASRLTIGPSGKVTADIKAKEVVVFGSIRGNVQAEERIAMRAGASVIGDVRTAGINIEDGAYFKGGIDISRVGEQKAAKAK